MSINVLCACGKPLVVKDEAAGNRVKCPACGESVPVPAAPTQPVETRPVPPAGTPTRPRRMLPWILGGIGAAMICCTGTVCLGGAAWKWWPRSGQPASGFASRGSPKEVEEKLGAAIRKCGSYGGSITSDNFDVLNTALDRINKEPGDLSKSLPAAARAVARTHPKGSFYILVGNNPGISPTELRAMLGAADSTQAGSVQLPGQFGGQQRAVTWHVYSWCAFGVDGERIIALKADCAALPAEPK